MNEYFLHQLRKVAGALEANCEKLGHLTGGDEKDCAVPDRERLENALSLIADALGEIDDWLGEHGGEK